MAEQQTELPLETPAVEEDKKERKDPADQESIPKARFDEQVSKEKRRAEAISAELQAEREAKIRLEERLKVLEDGQQQQQPSDPLQYNRTQLQELVDRGDITQAQMDDVLTQQRDRESSKKLESLLDQKLDEREKKAHAIREIGRYKGAIPDLLVDGSEAREKVRREFQRLRADGHSDEPTTELLALRIAYGDVDRVAETTDRHRRGSPEAGGSPDRTEEPPSGGPQLSSNQKAYYQSQIDKNYYSGWSDPKLQNELKYVKAS